MPPAWRTCLKAPPAPMMKMIIAMDLMEELHEPMRVSIGTLRTSAK